ncbi:universal stress protein [Caballeronia sp. dw_276]|jgi:nucleotide-binding universal stress UspA family protein|uniref:universal stress protein n=1 Tax=Caballeronia sp. dw_276 TaxID=2719795 RepID=UPI001BD59EC3|nr:universal stress protein [Caballeronia sp. dw_276]
MSYTSILVQLDTSSRSTARLKFAMQLARKSGAHLTGALTSFTPDPRTFYVMAGYSEYFEDHQKLRLKRQSALEQIFHAELEHAGVAGRWVENIDYPINDITRLARCADLVVAGQEDPDDPESFIADHFPATLVMSAGRPVLFHPCAGDFATLGENVMVAWNGSRESVRAVHDALPLLRQARRTTIVTVDEPRDLVRAEGIPGADIAIVLARHGVKADVVQLEQIQNTPAGSLLLSQASELAADLIVMGAYGHSRWHELVMGGATRSMFQSMTIPVLMSH